MDRRSCSRLWQRRCNFKRNLIGDIGEAFTAVGWVCWDMHCLLPRTYVPPYPCISIMDHVGQFGSVPPGFRACCCCQSRADKKSRSSQHLIPPTGHICQNKSHHPRPWIPAELMASRSTTSVELACLNRCLGQRAYGTLVDSCLEFFPKVIQVRDKREALKKSTHAGYSGSIQPRLSLALAPF